jgi:phosphoadenosine phosphosulfate reductase
MTVNATEVGQMKRAALPSRSDAQSSYDALLFDERLAQAGPKEIIEEAARAMPGRLAVVSSFGTESAVLLKFVADVDPSLPILFLDTLWLFKETLAYRDALIARLALTDVRTVTPSPSALALRDAKRDLCFRDRDACCGIRKVAPLAKELEAFDGWISGRKRYHGGERAALAVVETDGPRLKFNPLARLTSAELNAIFESTGTSVRGGRWSGLAKTECGIHTMAPPAT